MSATKESRPWIQLGNTFKHFNPTATVVDSLPLGVYEMAYDDRLKEIFLQKIDDSFTFNHKIYGLETSFMDHVMKTYEHTSNNLGILLDGTKGTGKTVCGKLLANAMGLPVILCNIPCDELSGWIAQFNSSAIFFFDEFEKNFSDNTSMLLSAMDGAFNTNTRKIFILTTNKLQIDNNFLSRPSRIRYKKTFGNLKKETIIEYCNDNLKNKEFMQDIIDFIDRLTISTIDILKTIVEEINIHDCTTSTFKDFFNVEESAYEYQIIACSATKGYSLEDFNKDCQIFLKENGHKKINDEEYTDDIREIRSTFHCSTLYSNRSIHYVAEGDEFNDETVLKPIDETNILVSKAEPAYYDNEVKYPYTYIKILNPNFMPSRYTKFTF